MEETRVHALDYMSVFHRRKWWLLTPIVLSVVVGLALVRFLPKEYRSTVRLGVDAPIVSPVLVNQPPPLDNQERMRLITQQLMSPSILARVAKEEGLLSAAPLDAVVNQIRKRIEPSVPDPIAQTNEVRRLDVIDVAYSDGDPARAQRVANRIARVFVEENSISRENHAESTSAFIASQLDASEKRLADLGARLQRAKEAHMGQLPEQTQANLQTLAGLNQQLQAHATALSGEQERLSMIDTQLEQVKRGAAATILVPRPTGGNVEVAQAPETRVMLLQQQLADAQRTYTDKHPEVQLLKEELAQARREAAADRQLPADQRAQQLQLDPAYRALMAERQSIQLHVHDLQRAEAETRHQIAAYQARVEQAPMVEQQLASVNRDYENEKVQYNELAAQLHKAQIAENVERNRRGERFTILYSASYPTEPTKPIPLRVMLMAVLTGIVLGGALTLGREYLDRSVHDVRDLKDEIELPVLGEVARIQTA